MTSREKKMALAVGVVAAVAVGKLVIWNGYTGYLQSWKDEIARKERDLQTVREKKQEMSKAAEAWHKVGSQTLSMDPDRVQTLLRDEMNRLTEECGLIKPTVTLGRLSNVGRVVGGQKNYVRILNCTVSAEGQPDSILRFIFRAQAQPYVIRFKTLTLTRPNAASAPKGQLSLSANIETVVLPPSSKVPKIVPAKLEEGKRPAEQSRLLLARYEDYQKLIVKKKVFQPYEPPPPVKATNPQPTNGASLIEQTVVDLRWNPGPGATKHKVYFGVGNPTELIGELVDQTTVKREGLEIGKTYVWRVDEEHEDGVTTGDLWRFTVQKKSDPIAPPPVVVQKQPPQDGQFIVGRILSSPRGQMVILEDRRNPQAPIDKRVEVGEPLFDGTLIFVHPRGVVSELDGQWRFHALGEAVQALKPLDERQFGDVRAEVLKLQENLAGITGQPGPAPGG